MDQTSSLRLLDMKQVILYTLFALCSPLMGQLKVGSLNPMATDLLRKIGQENVTVIELVRVGDNIHQFEPRPKDVRKLQECALVFGMGKGLEPYLDKLRDSLSAQQEIIEIGRTIPSQKIDGDPIYACCPNHAHGALDPHWWHNVKYMERATKVVSKALAKADPAHASEYKQRGRDLGQRYRNLHRWVKSELANIPPKQRILVTAHVAFAYFCKEYGFDAAYVQGLTQEGKIASKTLAETIVKLRERQVKAIFPEVMSNPKVLRQIAKETGAKLGEPLYADNISSTYEDMIRYNINTIVASLR